MRGIFLLAGVFASATTWATEVVHLVYEPVHNPPQALGATTVINWEKPGLTLEILKRVEKRLDVQFQFKRLPWKRGLYMVEHNQADGIFHASYKPAREKIGVYPKREGVVDPERSIFYQSYVVYKRTDSEVDYDGKAIQGVGGVVGAVAGYSVINKLKKMGHTVLESPTLKSNFSKLSSGKVDAFAGLENMSDDFLHRNSHAFQNITKVETKISSKPYYLLFSHGFVKRNPQLAEQIWSAAAEIKKSEEFQQLLSSY